MDDIDIKILNILENNGRMSHEEISKMLNMSRPAVHQRVSKLEKSGIIKGYNAVIDWSKTVRYKRQSRLKAEPAALDKSQNYKGKFNIAYFHFTSLDIQAGFYCEYNMFCNRKSSFQKTTCIVFMCFPPV